MSEVNKRKDWIKNAAIIFLIIMLILTFFSNTIMNYSLPEVAAQYCMSGSITNKVRGTGVVESQDPYSVIFNQSRKVGSVAVSVGQTVEKGDVLFYLEEGESEELKAAEETLQALKNAYDRAIVTGQISSSITSSVENGKVDSTETKQQKIEEAKSKVTKAESNIAKYEKEIENIDTNISNWTYDASGAIPERVALEQAKKELATWQAQKAITVSMVANAEAELSLLNPGDSGYDAAVAKRDQAYASDSVANTKVAQCENKVAECQAAIDAGIAFFTSAKATAEKNLMAARTSLATAQENLTKLVDKYSTQFDLQDKLAEIAKQEAIVESLRGSQGGSEIVAPVSGMVISLSYVAGETINAGDTVSTIQVSGKGFTLSMIVTAQQAALLSIGDEAEVTNSWWYSDIHARITSIRPDPSNPSQSRKVEFEVMGDVSNGQSLSLIVGRRSANYDCIVPTSAIREDNNGKFIYRVTSKSTPLGVRYYAERVDVTILAEDDTQSAVSGDLTGWEFIITTSTKPVEDGMQIRLKD